MIFAATELLAQSKRVPGMIGAFIVPCVVVLIIVLVVFVNRATRKARAALLAKLRSLPLDVVDKPGDAAKGQAYALMGMTLPRAAKGVNMIARGIVRDRQIAVVEHLHIVSTGKSSHPVYWTFAIIDCPEHWPSLVLSEEHLGDKIMKLFGKDRSDVQTASKAFDDRWRVSCDDEDFAVLVLSEEVQAWANALPSSARVSLGNGHASVAIKAQLTIASVDAFVDAPSTLLDLLPPELEAYGSPA